MNLILYGINGDMGMLWKVKVNKQNHIYTAMIYIHKKGNVIKYHRRAQH
jgi:hypothetical protein